MCPNTLTDDTSWEMISQCFHNAPLFARNWSRVSGALCAIHLVLFVIVALVFMMRAKQDETTHLKIGWVIGRRLRNPIQRYFIDYRWWVFIVSLAMVGAYWWLLSSYLWRPKQLFDAFSIRNSIWSLSPQGIDFFYQTLQVTSISGILLALVQLMVWRLLSLDPYSFKKFKIRQESDSKYTRVFVRPRRHHGLPIPGKGDKEISPNEPIEFYQSTIYIGRETIHIDGKAVQKIMINLNCPIDADLEASRDDLHWIKLTIKETYQNRLIPRRLFPIRKYQLQGDINNPNNDSPVFVAEAYAVKQDTVDKGQYFVVHDCLFRFG